MADQRILIVGEVYIDVHLDRLDNEIAISRLGGIFHAARACSAIGANFSLAYCAPSYLDSCVTEWGKRLNAVSCHKFENIYNAPNVMLVSESTEAGEQGYNNIFREQACFNAAGDLREIILITDPTDIIVFPGRYSAGRVCEALAGFKGRIHIDCAYDASGILGYIHNDISSIFLSTSSNLFQNECHSSFNGAVKFFEFCEPECFFLKEGRGGAQAFEYKTGNILKSPSHNSTTVHSVGVGDVYDVFAICFKVASDLEKRMRMASFCAACYSRTLSFDMFKENASNALMHSEKVSSLPSSYLPWDDRKKHNIYLAGPDFPDNDTRLIDNLNRCLLYQNFSPRLPIRENGLAGINPEKTSDTYLYAMDYKLLEQCSLLIATLTTQDPGTFTEIGIFKHMGKPVIIYDPYGLCTNMFVVESADYICKNIDSVITAVFESLGKRV